MPESSENRTGVEEPQTGAARSLPPRHLVITVHGIRTFGNWQHNLENLLKEVEPGVTVLNYQYGYFSSIAFLVPPLRWLVARQFRKFLVHEIRNAPPDARIDLVAHSFGTYLAASALPYIPEERKVNTVVFAGSVLRPSFPWYKYQCSGTVGRVINECGWDDSILLICQFSALMMGMAGRIGFAGMVGDNFTNRFYRIGHGGYFDRANRFMRDNWVPLLTREDPIPEHDERPELTAWGGAKLFMMNNLQFIKLAGALLMALVIVLLPLDWWRKLEYQKRNERFARIAKLANAMKIPGSDPSHVLNLLRIDASQNNGEDQTLDQLVGGDVSAGAEDLELNSDPRDEVDPKWWELLLSLRGGEVEAARARLLHARANYQLAAGKQGRTGDPAKAKLLYEQAIRCYKRVDDDDPAHGSYALCLMDYGALLRKMGLPAKAVEQFRTVREQVFPVNEHGERPTMPQSLIVDSFCNEAAALKEMGDWENAKARFFNAREKAAKQDELTSYVDNEIAWLFMERLNVAKAVERFKLAKESCEKLLDNGQFIFTTRLFHVRHGLAMAQRLKGRPDEAYHQYEQIVKELKGKLEKDFDFDPKERRDLWDRLVNSLERRADVWFFARESTHETLAEPAPTHQGRRNADLAKLKAIERDYDEALKEVGNDDLSIKARLLYKKVITHVLGEIKGSAVKAPSVIEAARGLRDVVEIDFAEAEATYFSLSPELKKDLKLYHQIAQSSMRISPTLRVEASRRSREVVSELRALTADYAARCDTLAREHVEMLLVANEVLLEPGVAESDPAKRLQDASRLLAVLGATKATWHEEMQPYADRFNRIAAAKMSQGQTLSADPKPEMIGENGLPGPAKLQGKVLFFWRISPTRSFVLTEGAADPALLSIK